MKIHYLRKTLAAAIAAVALLVNHASAADLTLASSATTGGTITVNTPDSLTISVGSSGDRTLSNAITLGGGTLKGGVMDNVATVSGLSGSGTSSTFVDANGVTIILRGAGTANTTADLTLASGVTVTGANQLLVGGGAGGGGGRASRRDGGGGRLQRKRNRTITICSSVKTPLEICCNTGLKSDRNDLSNRCALNSSER